MQVYISCLFWSTFRSVRGGKFAAEAGQNTIWLIIIVYLAIGVNAGLQVRRKHKHKHKPRVNRDDASTSARKRNARLCMCLRRPGSHVACACACVYIYVCVVCVNQPLESQSDAHNTMWNSFEAQEQRTHTIASRDWCRVVETRHGGRFQLVASGFYNRSINFKGRCLANETKAITAFSPEVGHLRNKTVFMH